MTELRDAATLRRRKGIGDSTFAVIQEALEGRVPDYLVDLRERAGVERTLGPARRCCAATCTATPTGRTASPRSTSWSTAARALGHEYLALTDHSPRLRVANGLSAERLRAQLEIVAGHERSTGSRCSGASRSTSSTTGGLDQERRAARRARRRRGLGALQAAHGARADDPAPGRARSRPARRRARPRARAGSSRARAARARRRRSTRGPSSRRAPSTASRSRSTRGPSARTRPTS